MTARSTRRDADVSAGTMSVGCGGAELERFKRLVLGLSVLTDVAGMAAATSCRFCGCR